MSDDEVPLLTRKRAAEFLRGLGYPVTLNMLVKAAFEGTGPQPAYKFGKRFLYTPDEVLRWAKRRRRPITSTTEAAQPSA
jgi:hypothetical protein